MEIKITVRNHMPFPGETEQYLRRKIEALEHLSNQAVLAVEAIIFEERYLRGCELLLKLKRKDFFARAEAEELNASIDQSVHKLKTQMEKYFKKKIDEKRRPK